MAEVLPDYIDDAARMFKSGNNNSSITVSSYKERTMIDVPGRYWDLIMNANQTVSDVGELKNSKRRADRRHRPVLRQNDKPFL